MTMIIDTLCPRFLCRKSKVGDTLATQFYLSPQAKKKMIEVLHLLNILKCQEREKHLKGTEKAGG